MAKKENIFAWEQRKLGELAEVRTGGTPKTLIQEYWQPKQVPWVSSGEVNKKRLVNTDNLISKKGLENSNAKWVKENSILIALAGQGKTRGTVAINEIPLTTNQSIAAIMPKDELYYEFIFQNLENRYEELRLISSGDGTRGGLNKQLVSDIEIISPTIDEQHKIGNFFKKIDNTLALLQDKLIQYQKLKKAFLQFMFPQNWESVPQVRFAKFSTRWEKRKLGEVAEFNPKSILPEQFEYVDLESVVGTSLISHRTEYREKAPSRAQRLAKQGDIFYQMVRPYQKNNFLFGLPYDNFVFSTGYAQLRPNVDSYFLLCRLQEERFVSNVLDRSTGTSYPAINLKDLAQIEIDIPTFREEQIKIGNFCRKLDSIITLNQSKLDQLKKLKSFLLQKMFV